METIKESSSRLTAEDQEKASKTSEDYTLTTAGLGEFSRTWKQIVWVVKVKFSKPKNLQTFGTAFCVSKDGLLLTSSHLFPKKIPYVVEVRRLDEKRFNLIAKVVYERPKWDVALLKPEFEDAATDCQFGKLADDGSLSEGQTLLHIGHPDDFVGSFVVGKVAYTCTDDVELPGKDEICLNYESTALEITPNYRVMGHIWNARVLCNAPPGGDPFEKNLHPLVPIIQMYGLACNTGSSGGPVFNVKGDIVGMLAMGAHGFDIAIHVTLLKAFLNLFEENKRKDRPNPTRQGRDSKKAKLTSKNR